MFSQKRFIKFLIIYSIFIFKILLTKFPCYGNESEDDEKAITDSSYVFVSAIKSVYGEIPKYEFFDLNFKFRFVDKKNKYSKFFALASMDISLSEVTKDTILETVSSKLSSASASVNFGFYSPDKIRTPFVGAGLIIFDGELYGGPSLGSIEQVESKFYPSNCRISLLRRFFDYDNKPKMYLYLQFLIHSKAMNFFKFLSIKGGILAPFPGSKDQTDRSIRTRITIAVPVGNVFNC